ncbi:HutD/Ves family protein [Marinomonas pollencensis]|uniref:HutD protein n=1 Tax=Marinomonas pollencensis TaxID=491954 RepID=A0A3E0DQ21_9GAMM|nr:HutD family protein [Marinomonas pollencensis]REG85057.1 hypothetical protein DFP81_103256 [Marinomonas pollencensis]
MTLNTPFHYQLIEQKNYQRMPWKNGLGETLEIQRDDDEQGLRFRISQASVADDGVFSDFSGLDRTLVLLTGNGMRLTHSNGHNERLEHSLKNPLDMARFTGGDRTYASLIKGPIEDLNIMVRAKDTIANVQAGFAPTSLTWSSRKALLNGFYANEDSIVGVQIEGNGDTETLSLPAQSFITFSAHPTECECIQIISGSGVLIEITNR